VELRPYQIRAMDYWQALRFVYLAIDMGLGKTAIVLHLINILNLPTLIVAPLKVAHNTWPDEIVDWDMQGDLSCNVLHGRHKLELFKQRAQVDVINYEGLPWLYKVLYDMFKAGKPMPYKILVLDESTFIKDYNSNRFGIVSAMRDMFTHIVNLSGTPSPNSLMDLWAQYYILDKGKSLGTDYRLFRNKFFEQDPYRKYRWTPRMGAENTIHRAIAPITFRLQSDDYISLPKRTFNTIKLELPRKERKMYESFKKDFVLSLDSATVSSLNKASLSSKLRQFVQGAVYENLDDGRRRTHFIHNIKVDALKQLLETIPGRNVLCAIQFQFEKEILKKHFPQAKFVTGKTKGGNQIIQDWKLGKVPLLFAHPKSVGRGLNLQTGGFTVIWVAPTFSLDDYLQFNKRLHRSGQKGKVVIHHLVLKGTIDERVYEILQMKGMTQERLLEYLRQETKKWRQAA
jgi:SNF2 family DNA or RNA helicase